MNKSLGIYNIIDKKGINKSIKNVIDSGCDFNTYSTPKGIKELRTQISNLITNLWDYCINYKDMVITNGTQQSINLIVDSLLKEGDTVLIEQPTYFGAIDIFKKRNVRLIEIDLYENGLDLQMLEEKIIKYSPKLIYATPTFNNPTGYSWTNENRRDFLNIINKHNVIVIEDDPYSLINFTRCNYYSLYKLNNGNNIIYLGTFSKIISPSINVGYIIANDEYINKIYSFKKSYDLCTSLFIQYVVLDYLKNNNIKQIINKRLKNYKKLKLKSIKELKKYYKNDISYITNSKGGLFYLVIIKNEIDKNVFESGDNYYIEGNHNNTTRINICSN